MKRKINFGKFGKENILYGIAYLGIAFMFFTIFAVNFLNMRNLILGWIFFIGVALWLVSAFVIFRKQDWFLHDLTGDK